jgi:anti-sigma factor RsiW
VNDSSHKLTLERFEQLLDRHGAELDRFPERDRAAAAELLAADPEARRLHAQAAALEAGLRGLPAPEPSAALRRAVAEIPLRNPQPAPGVPSLSRLPPRRVFALFASAALMVALGALSATLTGPDPDLSPLAAESEQDEPADDDLDILTELAFASELDDELAP